VPKQQPITDLLQQAKSGNRAAANAIVSHFWAAARQAARRNLTAAVRRFQSESDLANAALRSAISELKKPHSAFASRDEFEHLIRKIIDRKKTSAKRHVLAEKRDARRTKAFDEDLPEKENNDGKARARRAVHERRDSTVAQVIAEELAQRVADIVNREPDGAKRSIATLGVIERLEPTEISNVLAAGGTTVFALRTIQKTMQNAKEKVAKALRADYGELLPPKSPKKSDKDTSKKGTTNAGTRRSKKASKKVGAARTAKRSKKKARNK